MSSQSVVSVPDVLPNAKFSVYYDFDTQPQPGAVLVYSQTTPNVGWSLNPKYYSGVAVERIWRLPTVDPQATR